MDSATRQRSRPRFIEEILAGIKNVECVLDDIIITGSTNEEHLDRLNEVLKVLNQHDIRLNLDTCRFFKDSVTHCGFRLKHGEINKCPDKIEAIRKAPIPRNVSELKSFLGLIQFYSTFASHLAEIASSLYKLLKNEVKFHWSSDADQGFEKIKEELCSPKVLVPFNSKKPLLLSHRYEDGSERPIAYYSRTLTETEEKYS